MLDLLTHPSPDQLQAFGQGRLDPQAAAAVEQHVAECDSCCRLLEATPADSFVGQLRHAQQAALATTADGAAGTVTDAPAIPPELADHPRYRVLGLIGQGGMGAVYRAEHRRMERLVALKVINPGLMRKPAAVERFRQEARAAARLSHPNIVLAHDADQAGDLHFLVMEYVEGRSLADVVAERGPLPVAEACAYVRQAALGLQHAHEQGMVHRDIKPHNLMVTQPLTPNPSPPRGEGRKIAPLSPWGRGVGGEGFGVVKILDFGLARFARTPDDAPSTDTAPAASLTGAGTIMGTADYIAPEQIADARAADIRSDIYSLGCTFYHLLTGRPPFPEGTSADTFRHHAETPIPIPEEWPDELKAIVGKMTAKKSEDRYATPAEVAEALSAVRAASPSELTTSAKRERPRRRSLIAAALVSLAALIVAAVVIIKIQTDKGEIVIQTDDPNIEIVTKKGGEIVRIRDPKSGQAWELDTKKLTMRDLEHPDGLALEVPWRGKVTIKSSGGKVVVMAGRPEVPIAKEPTFQPLFNGKDFDGWKSEKAKWAVKDGVIIADRAGELVSERAVAKNFRLRMELKLKRGAGVVRFRVPPSGEKEWCLALLDNRLGMMDGMLHKGRGPEDSSARKIAKMDEWIVLELNAQNQEATVRIDGKQVLYFHDDRYTPEPGHIALLIVRTSDPDDTEMHVRKIEIMELPGAETTKPIRTTDPVELAKLPNAADALKHEDVPEIARAYVGGGDPKKAPPELVAVLGDVRFRRSVRDPEHQGPMAISHDGKHLAVANDRGDIQFFDVQTGRLLRQITSRYTPSDRMAFSPDGKRLFGTHAGDFNVLDAETGRLVWKRKQVTSLVNHFDFSADGKAIFLHTGGGKPGTPTSLEKWDAETGTPTKYSWPEESRRAFAISPDGMKSVEITGAHLLIRDLSGFKEPQRFPRSGAVHVAFSPDGKHFVVARVMGKKDEDKPKRSSTVTIHDAEGQVLHTLPEAAGTPLSFTADGKSLIIARGTLGTRTLGRWDVASGKQIGSWTLPGSDGSVDLVLSPDGQTLALRRSDSFQIELYDTETGKPRYSSTGPAASIAALAFSADGKYLASTDRSEMRLWDLATARAVGTWKLSGYHHLIFSPDAKLLVGASGNSLWVHQMPDGQLLHRLEARTTRIEDVAFSPDGSLIAATGDGDDVRLWRVSDGKELRILSYPRNAQRVSFSPDGSKLIAAGGHGIRVWETHTGLQLKHFLRESRFRDLEWLPDGKTLAALPNADMVMYLNPESGAVVREQTVKRPSFEEGGGWGRFVLGPGARVLALVHQHGCTLTEPDADPARQWAFWVAPSRRFTSQECVSVAFSPDGRYLAVGNPEGVISLLRLAKRGKVPELPVPVPDAEELAQRPNAADALKHENVPEVARAHVGGGDPKQVPPELVAVLGDVAFRCPGWAGQPAFSPDGKLLAVPGEGNVLLFDATTGRVTRSIPASGAARVAFSPDGRTLAAACAGQLELWDLENGKRLHQITVEKPQFWMHRLAFSPDSKLVAVGCGESEQVRVWEVRSGRSRFFWDGRDIDLPRKGIDHLAFSPDGRLLVVADPYNQLKFWEVTAEGDFKKATFAKDFPAGGRHFAFSPDGKVLAVYDWTETGAILVYDAKGKLLHRLPVREGSLLAFAKDSRTLMSIEYGDRKYVIRRWDVASGKSQPEVELASLGRYVHWAFSPDGKTLAVVQDEYDAVVRLIDTETGKPRIQDPGHSQEVYDLAFSPDGKLLAAADRHRAKLWNLATGQVIHTWENKSGRPLAFSPDSRMLAIRVGKSSIELRDTKDGQLLHSLSGPEEWITEIAFSPDGKRLAAGGFDPMVWVWRTDDGKKEQVLDQKAGTYALAFSPDGRSLIAVTGQHDNTLRVWDLTSGKEKLTPRKVEVEAYALTFLPDGKTLAGLQYDGRVWLRDWETGDLKREFPPPNPFEGEVSYPMPVALGPAARLAANETRAGQLILWQPDSNPLRQRALRLFPAGGGRVTAIALSPDGRYVAAGNPDGTICLLRLAERGKVPELPPAPAPEPIGPPREEK